MVILPREEAERLNFMIPVNEKDLTTTVTTTCTEGEGWTLNLSSGMPVVEWFFEEDKIYHNKVLKALGKTHYAKNGKLYRK